MPESGPRPGTRRPELSVDDYVQGILQGDRAVLARAITLVESNSPAHQEIAQQVLIQILPHTGKAHRVGITGVPGVGKSTFIESLGTTLTSAGHQVAVLAVDPTSGVTGGSILGDKTRMSNLSVDPNAFIRPSPTSGSLGGVNRKTRETSMLCEAAGFDVILIETVGVGQSETVVADMVDFFLVLMLAGAGDELQGIKRGILELADMVAINKADGDNVTHAKVARSEYAGAIRYLKPASKNWAPPVITCSGLNGEGLPTLWEKICEHREILTESGELETRRHRQWVSWMWSMIEDQLLTSLKNHPEVSGQLASLEEQVIQGELTPTLAAQKVLKAFGVLV
ncbi:MAG: methylmalonyl Co-A mutase-associated GTPase MeaB [Deltaproteobacteria bacterium]|nr:methylmalonyl Co-A mutase-associated GTPase MeaB [Deltaproteobacteria bacterium]